MTADSITNSVSSGSVSASGGGAGSGSGGSPSKRNLPSVWAQVVRGGTESDSVVSVVSDTVVAKEEVKEKVREVKVVENKMEGSDSGNGNEFSVKKPVWKTAMANGVVEGSGSVNPVMGAVQWPALSDALSGVKTVPESSSSTALLQAPVVSQAPPLKHGKPYANVNNHNNQNHGKHRPSKRNVNGGGNGSGSGSSGGYNRPSTGPPPPPLPPPPPPFPIVGVYGNLIPAVLEPPQRGWSPRPLDHRNPGRRNNYGPRPMNNGYSGRRDHHGPRSSAPRDVHMQHQMGPPPPPPIRGFMRPPPFLPPPLRPYGPMGYDMGPSYVYVPTLPEAYRGGAPVLPHGPPGSMFMPRMDHPFQDPILKQIDYYFSDDNLVKDNFLRSHMDEEGWVPLSLVAGFRRVENLTKDVQMILNSLRNSSTVEISAQDDKLRRRNEWRRWIHSTSQFSREATENAIEEATLKNLTLEDKPTNEKEAGPSNSLKLLNGEVSGDNPSS